MKLLVLCVLLAGSDCQECGEESWLSPGSTPPLNPDCDYDGSLVPDCQHFLTNLTSYYHVHQYDCSKFWQCTPSGACLQSCPPCPPGACPQNNALSFDCRYQAPLGPVCDWPHSIDCSNSPPCDSDCCSDQDCQVTEVCVEGSCQAPSETVCQEGWTGHADNCYRYVGQKKNWDLARESCVEEYQAELVSIHNDLESDFVLSFYSGTKFWTGGQRECDWCEAWVWSDGSGWDFSNWREGREPNNSTGPENCAEIGHYQDSWNDWKCDKQIHYVCKRGPHDPSCPEGWTEAGERCFLYVEDRMTWEEAEAFCNTDEEENDLVFSMKSNSSKLWLGGRRACSGCEDWSWSDGSDWSWQNWDAPEPNNLGGSENCIDMGHHQAKHTWNDWGCNNKLPFICQKYKQ